MPRAIVIGAGISGLSAAFRLEQRGIDTTVLESASEVGGKMRAVRRDGWIVGQGAALLPSSYKHLGRLAYDTGGASRLHPIEAHMGVVKDHEIHRVRASGAGALVDGARTSLLSTRSKLSVTRLLIDVARARRDVTWSGHRSRAVRDAETVGEYCERRIRPEVRDAVIEPLLNGLFLTDAMDASVVDLDFVFGRMLGGPLFGTRGGVDGVCRHVAAELDVRTNAPVHSVQRRSDRLSVRWDGGEEEVDGCVLAVDAPTAVDIFPELDPAAADLLTNELTHVRTIAARFALRQLPAEPATAIVIPGAEYGGLSTVIQEHLVDPGVAPPACALLATFWSSEWCEARFELPDDALAAEMLDELVGLLPDIAGNVEFVQIDRWAPSNPAFGRGAHKLVARLHDRLDRRDRVQFAGDYLTGLPLVESCVISGRDAATRLADRLR